MASGKTSFARKKVVRLAAVTAVAVAGLAAVYFAFHPETSEDPVLSMATAEASPARAAAPDAARPTADSSLTLDNAQLKGVKVEEVKERLFSITRKAAISILTKMNRSKFLTRIPDVSLGFTQRPAMMSKRVRFYSPLTARI